MMTGPQSILCRFALVPAPLGRHALAFAGAISVILFCSAVVLVPLMVVRVRPDYFAARKRHASPLRRRRPILVGLLTGLKNVLGAILVLLGATMVFIPGQGLLTMFMGLTLMNYPGKYRFERWLVTREPVWRAVNWLRTRAGVPPLEHPYAHEGEE